MESYFNFRIFSDPDHLAKNKVIQLLDEYNSKFMTVSMEDHAKEEITIYVEDKISGEIIGGLLGHIEVGWINVDKLVVDPAYNGKGIGKEIIRMVENLAVDRGLTAIYVTTREWQAPWFYEKNGFVQIDTRIDRKGNKGNFYKKSLIRR